MMLVRFTAHALWMVLASSLLAQVPTAPSEAPEAPSDGQAIPGITRILIRSEKLELGSTLWVRNRNGDIRVVAWEKDEVHLIAEIRDTYRRQVDVSIQPKGNDLDIETVFEQPFLSFDWNLVISPRCEMTLFVPRRLSGHFRTTNGSIFVSYLGGYVRCETNNGDIEIKHFSGEALVETKNGSIEAQDLQARIKAVTTNGQVTLIGVDGGIVAATTHGSIVAKSLDGWGEGISLSTTHGSIDLSLGDATGEISAESADGSLNINLPDAKALEVSKRKTRLRVPGRKQKINLRTTHGTITLRE